MGKGSAAHLCLLQSREESKIKWCYSVNLKILELRYNWPNLGWVLLQGLLWEAHHTQNRGHWEPFLIVGWEGFQMTVRCPVLSSTIYKFLSLTQKASSMKLFLFPWHTKILVCTGFWHCQWQENYVTFFLEKCEQTSVYHRYHINKKTKKWSHISLTWSNGFGELLIRIWEIQRQFHHLSVGDISWKHNQHAVCSTRNFFFYLTTLGQRSCRSSSFFELLESCMFH